jgi:GDP-L-fucose synthase
MDVHEGSETMIDLKTQRILVTGGTGFFGTHIVDALTKHGCLDVSVSNSMFDLRRKDRVYSLLNQFTPDIIIHCAAHCGGIGLNKERPAELFYDNIMMGATLMDAAHEKGIKKFVQLGTVCEYPKFTPIPFHESNLWEGYPEETNAPYGIAKKALLVMGQAYRQQYGFNVIHLLPVNLYGPRDNFDPKSSHVIPALIRKFEDAVGKPSLSVWGSGNAFREFLYVEDAAEAVVLATERYDGPEPINVGAGRTISIRDLVGIIAKKVGFTGEIVFDATMPDGQPERCLNTERAFQEFGFEAHTTFSDGLDKTIEWYHMNHRRLLLK